MYKYYGIDKFPEIKYAISDVSDGNMSYVWGNYEKVLKNRKTFLSRNNFDINCVINMHINNAEKVVVVNENDIGRGMYNVDDAIQADGIMTNNKDVGLLLAIGDCSPVILYDDTTSTLGLIHINRKNASIAKVAVELAILRFGSKANNLKIFIGPSIQKESFKIINPIQSELDDWHDYLHNLDNGETEIDMVGYIKHKFIESGVLDKNIYITDVDTYKESNLFSHYRAIRTKETEGRFAVVAKLS